MISMCLAVKCVSGLQQLRRVWVSVAQLCILTMQVCVQKGPALLKSNKSLILSLKQFVAYAIINNHGYCHDIRSWTLQVCGGNVLF